MYSFGGEPIGDQMIAQQGGWGVLRLSLGVRVLVVPDAAVIGALGLPCPPPPSPWQWFFSRRRPRHSSLRLVFP